MSEETGIEVWKELVVGELMSMAHDPHLTMEQARASLGQVYWQANERGDEATQQMALTTLDNLEALLHSTNTAISIAAAAKQIAMDMQSQRDTVIADRDLHVDKLNTLTKAALELDTDHPIVSKMYDAMIEDAYDYAYDSASADVESYVYDTWEQGHDFAMRLGNWSEEIEQDDATAFWSLLGGEDPDGEALHADELAELQSFILEFTARVMLRVKMNRESRKASAAQQLKEWHERPTNTDTDAA